MIADDLAGACDTGVEFLESVESVTVVIDSDTPDLKMGSLEGLTVWNTESRSLAAREAYVFAYSFFCFQRSFWRNAKAIIVSSAW